MFLQSMRLLAICSAFAAMPISVAALESSAGRLTMTPVVEDLDQPWGFDFLPGGGILITERDGAMLHVTAEGKRVKLRGVPRVVARGQGGLLDVTVARNFAQTREFFFTYVGRIGRGTGTVMAKARLSDDGARLENVAKLFEQTPADGGLQFGSRVVEARDGTLFVTVGDRGDGPSAQDRTRHNGSVVRVTRNGQIPADNPFVGQDGIQPQIWSYGHRNPQGAGLDLNGNLWISEHGARGGDEVNRIKKGANFGWPVISYGVHYSGAKIGEGTTKPGMEQPIYYWDPSIAPSGLMVYSGKLFPDWRGDIFVGSLKFDYISRLDGENVREIEQLKSRETGRVRDILEGPEGGIWFLSVDRGTLYRIAP